MNQPAGLLELALTQQETRNTAALAAIRARASDITEAQRLVEALAARGLKVAAIVDTQPVGALAICDIVLWVSATETDLQGAFRWLEAADVAIARDKLLDRGDIRVYRLTLRGQTLRLKAAIYTPDRKPFSFNPRNAPEAA